MNGFKGLEAKYHATPVTLFDSRKTGSGHLTLDREKTRAVLSLDQGVGFKMNNEGWFDLDLVTSHGENVRLVNAIKLSSESRGGEPRYNATVFPNVVVLRPEALTEEGMVAAVSFRLAGWESYFHYQFFERIPLYPLTENHRGILQSLRSAAPNKWREAPDFLEPDTVYIGYTPGQLLSFQTSGRRYSISAGGVFGTSWHRLSERINLVGTIEFDTPLSIERALGAVWDWRQFFTQMGMCPAGFRSMAMTGDRSQDRWATVYLPNAPRKKASVHPGDVTLNFSTERNELASVMRLWLEKMDERRNFRWRVAQVIDKSRGRVVIDHLVTLCAAIESLPVPAVNITDEHVEKLAIAAEAQARNEGIDVRKERLSGILSMLQHQGIHSRLKQLMKSIEPHLLKSDAKILSSRVQPLRTIAAHGVDHGKDTLPTLHPTIVGLAGACALYDLVSSGVPVKREGGSELLALRQIRQSVMRLRELRVNDGPT